MQNETTVEPWTPHERDRGSDAIGTIFIIFCILMIIRKVKRLFRD